MKKSIILLFAALTCLVESSTGQSQPDRIFPIDPYVILKTWDYEKLLTSMGAGEEVFATSKNQTYLAGLRYTFDFLGMTGKLEFTFTKDSISRIQFSRPHEKRVVSSDLSGKKTRDPSLNQEFNIAIQKLDSLQKIDSLSRDSVVRAISDILGPPLSNSRTAVSEKNARHSAIWINRGYSCLFKDYIDYSEVVFAIPTVAPWVVGEFNIPAGTEIIRKIPVNTKKMGWTASLLGFPSAGVKMLYSDVFLLLEFTSGQRYLASIPKNARSFLRTSGFIEFGTGQRFLLSIPNNSICYLPTLSFEDCDGNAIPEALIHLPIDNQGSEMRHCIFSLEYKEPNLIFDSEDQLPGTISVMGNSRIQVTFQDATTRITDLAGIQIPNRNFQMKPEGFAYFRTTRLNSDGSANFSAGILLSPSPKAKGIGILDITFKHISGGWETGAISFSPATK